MKGLQVSAVTTQANNCNRTWNRLKKKKKQQQQHAPQSKRTKYKVQVNFRPNVCQCLPRMSNLPLEVMHNQYSQPIFNGHAYIQGQQAYSSRVKSGKFENPTLCCGPEDWVGVAVKAPHPCVLLKWSTCSQLSMIVQFLQLVQIHFLAFFQSKNVILNKHK